MGQEPEPTNSPIQNLTAQLESFVRWLAELIQRCNWFTLLLLIDAALILFFAPGSVVPRALEFLGIAALPDPYATLWGLAVGLLFLAALTIAVRTMLRSRRAETADIHERKAIKGLRPFGKEDAEIFAQLQRQRSLRGCYEAVTRDSFRIGILLGESGCGKTSFLQAGLWPKLLEAEGTHSGVYVRLTAQNPIESIQRALVEQLQIEVSQTSWESPTGTQDQPAKFLTLLRQGQAKAQKPMVLLLDQLEQFFVHYKLKRDREPFVAALTAWYQDSELPVKVLISIREDLSARLVELQYALQYSLGPQEVFRLEKFEPAEATRILEVIAETEQLKFDRAFVTKLAAKELGSREDGLISPVDLQVLAWMIERQNTADLRAFDEPTFQKFGGVEGLLMRFLDEMMKARMTTTQFTTSALLSALLSPSSFSLIK